MLLQGCERLVSVKKHCPVTQLKPFLSLSLSLSLSSLVTVFPCSLFFCCLPHHRQPVCCVSFSFLAHFLLQTESRTLAASLLMISLRLLLLLFTLIRAFSPGIPARFIQYPFLLSPDVQLSVFSSPGIALPFSITESDCRQKNRKRVGEEGEELQLSERK